MANVGQVIYQITRNNALILMRMNGTKGVYRQGNDLKRLNSKTVTASGAPFAVPVSDHFPQ